MSQFEKKYEIPSNHHDTMPEYDNVDFDSVDFEGLFYGLGDCDATSDEPIWTPFDDTISDPSHIKSSSRLSSSFKRQRTTRSLDKPSRTAKDKNAYRSRHNLSPSEPPPPILQTFTTMPDDIRRNYSLMFTNTLNSQDFPLFLKFLTKYTSQDFTFNQTYNEPLEVNNSGRIIELNGLNLTAQFWFNKLRFLPDVAYSLFLTNVHTYNNTGESKVVGAMASISTAVFDVPLSSVAKIGLPSSNTLTADDSTILSATEHDNNSVSDIQSIDTKAIDKYLAGTRLVSQPTQRVSDIQLVMHLDSNKSIKRMEFNMVRRIAEISSDVNLS